MRSRASFKGHPIHPMIIPFPIGFLIGALAFDVIGSVFGNVDWHVAARLMIVAGVLTALLAAVPGLVDYVFTVPPNSTGKKRATKHMIVNLTAVALFAAAFVLRGAPADPPAYVVLVLEAVGAALLTAGGWMGGVLVGRNQISVDHRYANKGKWQETTLAAEPGSSVQVAERDELELNQMKLLRVGDRRIVLGRTEAGFVAFDDHCTHRGGSLAGGVMICGTVQCPWHGSQYDVKTGEVRSGPAKYGIDTYAVEETDGKVMLTLPKANQGGKR